MDKADRIIKINEAVNRIYYSDNLSEGIYDWMGEKIAGLFGASSSELQRKKSPEELKAEIDRQRAMTPEQRRAEQDKELNRLSNVESNIAKTETGVRVARDATLTGMQILAPGVGTALATGVRAGTAGAMAASGDTEGAKNELVSGAIDVATAGAIGVASKGIGAAAKLGSKALGIGGKAAAETAETAAKTATTAGGISKVGAIGAAIGGIKQGVMGKIGGLLGKGAGTEAKTTTLAQKEAMLQAASGTSRGGVTTLHKTGEKVIDLAPASGSKITHTFGKPAATGIATAVAKPGIGAAMKKGLKTAAVWYAMNKILGGGSSGSNATSKPAKQIGSAATSQDYGSLQGSGPEQERDINAYQARINKARGMSSVAVPA